MGKSFKPKHFSICVPVFLFNIVIFQEDHKFYHCKHKAKSKKLNNRLEVSVWDNDRGTRHS